MKPNPATPVNKDAPLCRSELARDHANSPAKSISNRLRACSCKLTKPVCALALLALVGCATPPKSPPSPKPVAHQSPFAVPASAPIVLNLTVTLPAAEVTLHTVTAPEKSDSFPPAIRWWDEYALTITSHSSGALTMTSATVFDLLDHGHRSGADPKKLAASSREDWRAYQKAGVPVTPKIPELAALKFILLAPVGAELAGLAGSYGFFLYGFALTPIIYAEALSEADKVRQGFAQRQLKLPLRLEPGKSAKGSLFFPMIPGPRRFVLQGESDGQPVEIVIPLTSISTLHLATAPAAPAATMKM